MPKEDEIPCMRASREGIFNATTAASSCECTQVVGQNECINEKYNAPVGEKRVRNRCSPSNE